MTHSTASLHVGPGLKGATSRYVYLKNFSLNFSSLSFEIRVNLLHPQPTSFLSGLFLPLWCLSTLANYYFKVSYNYKAIFNFGKITEIS